MAARQAANQAGIKLREKANERLAQANRRYGDGGHQEVLGLCLQAETLIEQPAQASLDLLTGTIAHLSGTVENQSSSWLGWEC